MTSPKPALLVLRALGLGDLLTAVPALRGLRRAFPGHRVLLAAPARLADAAAATGTVDGLLPVHAPDRGVPARIPWTGTPPELAVDLHGSGPASLRPLRALRPGRLYGYARPDGPVWREDEHERERWCRLLGRYGVPADPGELHLDPPLPRSPAPGAVLLHPGADAAARRWPPGRFAAVARALHRAGRQVVVTAGAGEEPTARAVAGEAGLPAGAVAGGDRDLPFPELAALVAEARAVVVGDTGLAHLATALGTPSVILFGPVSPRLWGPPESPRHRVLYRPGPGPHPPGRALRPGDAHGDRPDERLLRITPHDVLAELEALPPPGRPRSVPTAAPEPSASPHDRALDDPNAHPTPRGEPP
ncbi:glycosyltransferase family 9 protein [Streptomyces sp. ACA25]|uniref:glycosyltransferase family 9 protein n=1 Tax=Streptomyces sp. ACA25 TaxID=3022596 RepID=UPI002307D95A|nr:glycosyltransferase family 9 protein [Streptomyces sp. ACA25]MDB1087848.1 glycosyltransferase family 9 protein [Streptomyces sp. ACA25]